MKVTLETIGEHCVAEKTCGRAVPTVAGISPAAFWEQARKFNAKICAGDGWMRINMVCAAGVVRVYSDPAVTGDNIRYE